MANPTTFPGDVNIASNLYIGGDVSPRKAKENILAVSELAVFTVPWTTWRTHSAFAAPLPAAATGEILGLVPGTHGTNYPCIQAGDVKGTTSTRYARGVVYLPWNYIAGESVQLRFRAGCQTNDCSTSCTLTITAYSSDGDNTVSAELYGGAAKDINLDDSFANQDFALTATNLTAGQGIDVQIAIAYNDGAAIEVIPTISKVQLLCDVR